MTDFEISQAAKNGQPRWFRVPPDIFAVLKVAAAMVGLSLQEWGLRAFLEKIERQEKEFKHPIVVKTIDPDQ
jgi:hypothetical protein